MLAKLRNLSKKKKERIQAGAFLIPFSLAASLMLYGALHWPHSMREKAGQYVDNAGRVFSEETYQRFLIWEISLFASFALLFTSVFVIGWAIGMPVRSLESVRKFTQKKKENAQKA